MITKIKNFFKNLALDVSQEITVLKAELADLKTKVYAKAEEVKEKL